MNTQELLDELLKSGRDLAAQGQELVERKVGLPAAGPEREAALAAMGKGAAVAGTLAVLLGTRAGRSITGAGLQLGGLAALGGLAFKAYQAWQSGGAGATTGQPVDQLQGPAGENRSRALLKAMIAAAKADGHIDADEQGKIDALTQKIELDPATRQFIQDELDKPLSAADVAASADSPAAASEIYLASLLAINLDSAAERAYLDELAGHLKLDKAVTDSLESEAKGA